MSNTVTPNDIAIMEGAYDGTHKACSHLALGSATLHIPTTAVELFG